MPPRCVRRARCARTAAPSLAVRRLLGEARPKALSGRTTRPILGLKSLVLERAGSWDRLLPITPRGLPILPGDRDLAVTFPVCLRSDLCR